MGTLSVLDRSATESGYFCRCRTWPLLVSIDGQRRHVGFEVELLGSHSPDPYHLDPHCPDCHRLRETLLDIAQAAITSVTSTLGDVVRCEAASPHASLILWPRLGNRALVSVTISIHPQQHFEAPVNGAESEALRLIQRFLSELGIHE